MTRHEIVNPDDLMRPVGFAHAVVAAPGRTVYLGGQTGTDGTGRIVSDSLREQLDRAAANVFEALAAAGARSDDLVSMQVFVTDAEEYRRESKVIGDAYRRHFGRHFPAMALFEIVRLYDAAAKVELVCIAVVPDQR